MLLHLLLLHIALTPTSAVPFPFRWSDYDRNFAPLAPDELEAARQNARSMFYHGYDNYMKHAFPMDELDPIHCTGRGHDHANP